MITAAAMSGAGAAVAQTALLPTLFPEGVPGYGATPGVTVQSRVHPELAAPGTRFHALQILPTLDVVTGYNSNVLGGAGGSARRGSWQVTTAPAVAATTDWSRDQLGASVSLQGTQYLAMPAQNQVNGTAAAGGRIDLGQDQLTIAAAHAAQHENAAAINAIASTSPISFQVDDIRSAYTLVDGRWNLTPSLDVSRWSYGQATVNGITTAQSYRDRVVVEGGVTLQYEWAELRNILVVVRALGQNYTHNLRTQPTTNSHAYQALAGVDYDDNALWRFRLLLGGESRQYAAAVYQPQNTFIAEAEATWFPTQLTTLRATLSRDTEDAAQEGVAGLVYTALRIAADHELRRDLLLRSYGELQQASYFGGGRQTGFAAGIGLTWSLNRYARLALTYDQSNLSGGQNTSQSLSTGYSRGLSLITFHLGL